MSSAVVVAQTDGYLNFSGGTPLSAVVSGDSIHVSNNSSAASVEERGLIYFDTRNKIPSTATIKTLTLTYNVTLASSGSGSAFSIYGNYEGLGQQTIETADGNPGGPFSGGVIAIDYIYLTGLKSVSIDPGLFNINGYTTFGFSVAGGSTGTDTWYIDSIRKANGIPAKLTVEYYMPGMSMVGKEPKITLTGVSSTALTDSPGPATWTHSVNGKSDLVIVTSISYDFSFPPPQVASVTYGGAALALLDRSYDTIYGEVWYAIKPPTNDRTVTVNYSTLGGGANMMAAPMAFTFKNVDLDNPISTNNVWFNFTSGFDLSNSFSPATTDSKSLVLGIAGILPSTITAAALSTTSQKQEVVTSDPLINIRAEAGIQNPGGDGIVGWTLSSASYSGVLLNALTVRGK